MNAVLAAWEHRRRIQQGWTRAAIRAQGVNVGDAQEGVVSVDVRLHGQADVMFRPGTGSLSVEGKEPEVGDGSPAQRGLLITAGILVLGDNIAEGQLIEAVALPWLEIIKELERNPHFLHQLDWRKVEELVAGAYKQDGWPDVTLTRRSGDGGRDIIARKPGFGAVCIYDQVKAYSLGHVVTADDVRALFGVVTRDHNVSKGIVTTTALFAPGVREEWKAFMPYRLDLRDGPTFRAWLVGLKEPQQPTR